MDSSSLPQLIPLLQTLLASPSPLTLGATLTAFLEICPDRLDLLHQYYRHICRLIVDADEWGQVVALEVFTRYARLMLEKPELPAHANGAKPDPAESEDEFEGLDPDLAMLLYCSKPLFQSRNPAVVLAVSMAYFHLAPLEHESIGQRALVPPLLRLAGAPRGGEEVTTLAWDVAAAMAEERPVI
jgi:AP-3 complex subunit beta